MGETEWGWDEQSGGHRNAHCQSALPLYRHQPGGRSTAGPPGFSVHGSLQARILEWVAISSSRGSSQPRDGTRVSCVSWTAGGFFTIWATKESLKSLWACLISSGCYEKMPSMGQVEQTLISQFWILGSGAGRFCVSLVPGLVCILTWWRELSGAS